MKKFTVSSALCIVSACTFLLSSGKTFAAWYSQGDTVNNITMKSVKGQIIEEYEQNQVVYPDAVVDKIVQVKNTGNADALPRVKIEKVWGDGRDENGNLLINPDLSTDNIEIVYNTDNWFYNEDDGYFYYRGVLKSGEMTASLFDSFKINGEKTCGDYKNKEADIIVNMELVQADDNGPSYWNTSFEELGITYTPSDQNMITEVAFNGPDDGFSFEVNGGDLFANFKNLVPGESRSQIIEITNNWNYTVEMFLWADYIVQSQATDETRELINKLLYQYAKIVITDEEGNVIYNGTVWGSPDIDSKDTDSMKYPYSLGNFKAHQTKRLNVSLYLDPQMDNEYKTLLGLIKWVFSAQGENTAISSGDDIVTAPPQNTDVKPAGEQKTTSTTVISTSTSSDTVTSTSVTTDDNNVQTSSQSTTDTIVTTTADTSTLSGTSTSVTTDDNNVQTSSQSTTDTIVTTTADTSTPSGTSTSVTTDDNNVQTSSQSTTDTIVTTTADTSTPSGTSTSVTTDDNNVQTSSQSTIDTIVTTTADTSTPSGTFTSVITDDNNIQTSSQSKTDTVVTSVTKVINDSGDNKGSPRTGDFNNVGLYGILSAISFIVMLLTYKKSKDDSKS